MFPQKMVVLLAFAFVIPALGGLLVAEDTRPDAALPVSAALDEEETADAGATVFSDLSWVARRDPGDKRDIKLRGDYAYTAGHSGIHIYDISTPTNPTEVGFIFCPSRDLDVVGNVLAAVLEGSSGDCGSSSGVAIVDISDPADPFYVKRFNIPAHTITAYGDTGIIHVASQVLTPGIFAGPGFQDIIDAKTAAGAFVAKRWWFPYVSENGHPVAAPSCHEITFRPDLNRGYCAAIVETHIWDTTDPLEPKVLSVIRNPSVSIHHGAFAAHDGDLLIINDEFGGALVNACFPFAEGKNPNGALWFYDVSNEAVPIPMSYVAMETPGSIPGTCTSHFGNVLPNGNQLVWGWYNAGPVLIDFSDVLFPTVVDSWVVTGAYTWGAYYHDGYVYTGDVNRGFEVFSIA